MSEAALEALESEAYSGLEGEGEASEGEAYGEGEASSEGRGEDPRSRAYRRAQQQQQIMLARRRQMQMRAPQTSWAGQPSPGARPNQATISALRQVDLDAKVAQDSLSRKVDRANLRASRATYSALATAAVSQVLDTYEQNLKDHALVRAAARVAPLAILPPDQTRRGVDAVLLHPAVIGSALIGAIFLIGKTTTTAQDVHDIRVAVPDVVQVGDRGTLVAIPVARNGRTVSDAPVTWDSRDDTILRFTDKAAGKFEAVGAGLVAVTATSGNVTVTSALTVKAAPGD
jgi:hypothetical protein